MDGSGRSWLESCCARGLSFVSFAAPARVVTISSSRESFENCSTDMKNVQTAMCELILCLWTTIYQPSFAQFTPRSELMPPATDTSLLLSKGRLANGPSVPCEGWGVNRVWLSGNYPKDREDVPTPQFCLANCREHGLVKKTSMCVAPYPAFELYHRAHAFLVSKHNIPYDPRISIHPCRLHKW
jgi:hypothetical protein